MRVHRSAHRHGVEEPDIHHAVDHALADIDLDELRLLVLGPDRAANLLEVVVVEESTSRSPSTPWRCVVSSRGGFRRARRGLRDEKGAERLPRGEEPQVEGRRGPERPSMGSGHAEAIRVRLDPELRRELADRARAEGSSDSELVRAALRSYLDDL